MLVYLVLLGMVLYVPILGAKHLILYTAQHSPLVAAWLEMGALKFELRLCYFVPQIQLPMEILFAHITFLSMYMRS
jgi:hypothetical protein